MISRLKPMGPVRLVVISFNAGINLTIKFPSADPRTAPSKTNATK
jgi:hypothetical protein